jgi:hypothetical protein
LWEEQRPWNVYHYSANNPIVAKDPTGLLPGDLFKTPFQAVHDFGKNYNPLSLELNVEFGTRIIEVKQEGETYYTYITPDMGDEGGVNTRETSDKQVAIAHTHAAYDPNAYNNEFSPADKIYAKSENAPSFLISPDGAIRLYDHNTDKTSVKSKDMPSDPKDPDRKNDVKPETPKNDDRPIPYIYNSQKIEAKR